MALTSRWPMFPQIFKMLSARVPSFTANSKISKRNFPKKTTGSSDTPWSFIFVFVYHLNTIHFIYDIFDEKFLQYKTMIILMFSLIGRKGSPTLRTFHFDFHPRYQAGTVVRVFTRRLHHPKWQICIPFRQRRIWFQQGQANRALFVVSPFL